MGIPACLWRRTGEIYKGNKEFAALVSVPLEMLREGRLCIYELMAEESAVNYWEVKHVTDSRLKIVHRLVAIVLVDLFVSMLTIERRLVSIEIRKHRV